MTEKIRGMGFIDFENINIAARQHKVNYLDFNKLAELMLSGFTRVGCKIYVPHQMRHLLPSIQRHGLDAILVSPGKSVDGRLIFDLLVMAQSDAFDTAILASGDRDYIPVVERVKQLNKGIKIVSFSENIGQGLKSVADGNILSLNEHIATIAQRTYDYKCSECGKDFILPFKLYPNQLPPKCPTCHSNKKGK